MSIKNLLLWGLPPVAIGGTGVGIWMISPKREETTDLDEGTWNGIKVGPDAAPTEEPKDLIRQAGLNCGDATTKKDCSIGSEGLNVDIGGNKKVNLFPYKTDNGNIKFRLSAADDETYKDKFRFTVTKRPIKLESKSNPNETIILEKYENYGLEKDNETNKVYLTRKLTKDQWIKKSLGLPDGCNLPTTVSQNTFDYKNATCTLTKEQIKLIKFDGKKNEGATTTDSVKLYIHKVNDTKTFAEGYKFTFHPLADVDISESNKLNKDVWWDFRLKNPNEETDDLVLERVWKSTEELLGAVGLTCAEDGTCTINDGSLKIKVGTNSMENGRRKSESTGTLKLERDKPGHYEGLRFSIRGGEITIEKSTSSDYTVQMQELEIFHIKKEDSNDSSHILARKHDLDEMILFYLGLLGPCKLAKNKNPIECTVQGNSEKKPLEKIKFHDGSGKQTISGNNDNSLIITVTKEEEKSTYPYGYKFSIKTGSGNITMGNISLTNTDTEFKIKKENGPNLYLEKVS